MSIRILVVDDHILVREGLRRALSREKEFSVVGEAASKREALVQIPHHSPDVLVVDLHLPDGNGLEVIAWARALSQQMGIVALTFSKFPEHILACIQRINYGDKVKFDEPTYIYCSKNYRRYFSKESKRWFDCSRTRNS